MKDLVPTPSSEWALYGDTSRAWPSVQAMRAQLATGKPEEYSFSALQHAVVVTDAGTLRQYLFAGGDPSAADPNDGATLLHLAVRHRSPLIVRLLVEAGANVNALDRGGASPLREALYEAVPAQDPEEAAERKVQTLEIVRLLVEAGAQQ